MEINYERLYKRAIVTIRELREEKHKSGLSQSYHELLIAYKKQKRENKKLKLQGVTKGKQRFLTYLDFTDILNKLVVAKYKGQEYINIEGFNVPTNDLRYETFIHSLTCSKCGIKGCILALEVNYGYMNGAYHFNLYALENGIEKLMTRDHIVPKSKGGKENISNMQTMCTRCNSAKGDKIEGGESI